MITIATLRAAGLTEAQVLRVIEIEEKERLANKREANRLRQREYRARNAVTRDKCDKRDSHIDTSLLPNQEKKERRKKAHALSAQWVLTEADRNFATTRNWPQARIDSEEERFRDYWLASGKAKADWAATWRNWVRSPIQNGGGQNGTARQKGDRRHSISATFDDIFAKLESGDGSSVVPFKAHPRLLPDR